MPPAVSSPPMTSSAPTPSVAICKSRRTSFDADEIKPLRTLARVCWSTASACTRPQRAIKLGMRPIASMASALRAAASACSIALPLARAEAASDARVTRSLTTASPSKSTAPTSATAPSVGCSRKTITRKIGAHGESRNGSTSWPDRNVRSECRSRKPCIEGSRPVFSGTAMLPASTVPASRLSSQAPTLAMILPRTASSAAIARIAAPMINVSNNNVSVERLDKTRSNTCSM